MKFLFEIEVEKTEGKYVTKDEVGDALAAEIEGLSFEAGDSDSAFEVVVVSDYVPPSRAKKVHP